jgi:hypothetical protein
MAPSRASPVSSVAAFGGRGAVVQQKDHLCGPYWAARILRDAGITHWDGEEIDEDLMARAAGTRLPRAFVDGSVPPGAQSRTDYRFELAMATPQEAGTAIAPLVEAIEQAGDSGLCCAPLHGEWTAKRVAGLVDAAPRQDARLVANIRSGALWGARPPPAMLLDELDGREREGPPPDWDVGHFCELARLLRGPVSGLVLVHDTYPQLGWEGRHLQPPRVVAGALMRDDGCAGGVLVVAPAAAAAELRRLADSLGLEVGIWDNGTPGR